MHAICRGLSLVSWGGAWLAMLFLAACSPNTQNAGAAETAVAGTVIAQITATAQAQLLPTTIAQTVVAQLTASVPTVLPTRTLHPATQTPALLPTATPLPVPSNTPTVTYHEVNLGDRSMFRCNDDKSIVTSRFDGGTLTLEIPSGAKFMECFLNESFSDFTLSVKLGVEGLSSKAYAALVFRVNLATNLESYWFMIRGNGRWELIRGDEGILKLLDGGELGRFTNVSSANEFQVVANGSKLIVFLNGEKLSEVTDSAYARGSVGVVVVPDGANPVTVTLQKMTWTSPNR